jgi:hypothetical protein
MNDETVSLISFPSGKTPKGNHKLNKTESLLLMEEGARFHE